MKADVGKVENELQLAKYKFRKKQKLANDVFIYWDYESASLEHYIILNTGDSLHFIREVTYEFNNKKEYLNLLSSIQNYGFIKNGSLVDRKNLSIEEFKKNEIHVIMTTSKYQAMTSTKPSNTKKTETGISYELKICYCTLKLKK